MVRIGAIVMNVSDTERAGTFWSQALGYSRGDNPDFLLPPDGLGPRLHLDRTDRTHLDLWTAGKEEQQAEVQRLIELGATRIDWDYPEDADFVVLADPEGNLFCIIAYDELVHGTERLPGLTRSAQTSPPPPSHQTHLDRRAVPRYLSSESSPEGR